MKASEDLIARLRAVLDKEVNTLSPARKEKLSGLLAFEMMAWLEAHVMPLLEKEEGQ